MSNKIQFLKHKAYKLRYWSIVAPAHAGSGHTTTCLSAADIVAVLFFDVMHYDPSDFENSNNDRFILSKGHASPLLYGAWREVGILSDEDMLTYRDVNSVLEGHPTLRFSHTEHATGSLGMGLSFGAGQALHAKRTDKNFYTYVLLGDSETTEGSVWEAVQLAVHYKLNNLIAIIDVNRLGQSTETMFGHNIDRYKNIFTSFGWQAFEVDGHDIKQLIDVFAQVKKIKDKPVVIIAKTIKGYGIQQFADKQGFHGKAVKKEQLESVLEELQTTFVSDIKEVLYDEPSHVGLGKVSQNNDKNHSVIAIAPCKYEKGKMISTRKAYGYALESLGDMSQNIVALDAEVKNSTFAEIFEQKHPSRFYQCFIAEQNMVGMAIGMQRRGDIPFVSTFAAFFSRAHDQIRMAAIGSAAIRLVGSHVGVSIGQDGPSQMGLEDIALMRSIPNSIVLYPSDAVSTHKLLQQMANYHDRISYMRTTRMKTPVLYGNTHVFEIGGCSVLCQSEHDVAVVIGAGVTLHEALKAHDLLQKKDSISIAVIDLYSIKPLDLHTILSVAKKSQNKIVVVEDHYTQGGIGEAIMSACCNHAVDVIHLSVEQLPRSGKPEELLSLMGIDANSIVKAVKK